MITISVDYTCKYRLNFAPNYVWTICGKCYNLKYGRLICTNQNIIVYLLNLKL